MPSCPGEDRDDTCSDQDIAGSHKKTYPEWAHLSFLLPLPPGSRLLMPLRVFPSSAIISLEPIGSWDRVLTFPPTHGEPAFRGSPKRALFVSPLHVQFAALHMCQKQIPSRIHLYTHTTTHTPGVCVTRTSYLSAQRFFLVLPFMFGIVTAGSAYVFFHGDSLTRLSTWRNERSLLLPGRRPERRRNTTNHPECFYIGTSKQHQPGQPELVVCRGQTVSSVCRHRIS